MLWLVREHRHARVLTCESHDVDDARIRARVVEEPGVVERKESGYRVRWLGQASRRERPSDQQRCTLADHGGNRRLGQRQSAEFGDQIVGGIGQITTRIDQGAIEVECNQAVYVAHDVGVSQTVMRATGSPCSRATSKISRAMRSTVGLLSSTKIGSPRSWRIFVNGSSALRIIL